MINRELLVRVKVHCKNHCSPGDSKKLPHHGEIVTTCHAILISSDLHNTLKKELKLVLHFFLYLSQTNTFQCMLATDGSRSFSIFLYLDDGIQWGEGAQIGFDAVETDFASQNFPLDPSAFPLYFSLPGAFSDSSVDIELTENTGTPGKWAFRLDPLNILQAGRKWSVLASVTSLHAQLASGKHWA